MPPMQPELTASEEGKTGSRPRLPQVIRKRRIVGRAFSPLDKFRRLSKDYKRHQQTCEA